MLIIGYTLLLVSLTCFIVSLYKMINNIIKKKNDNIILSKKEYYNLRRNSNLIDKAISLIQISYDISEGKATYTYDKETKKIYIKPSNIKSYMSFDVYELLLSLGYTEEFLDKTDICITGTEKIKL